MRVEFSFCDRADTRFDVEQTKLIDRTPMSANFMLIKNQKSAHCMKKCIKETGDGSDDPLFYEILLLIESFSLPLRCFFYIVLYASSQS